MFLFLKEELKGCLLGSVYIGQEFLDFGLENSIHASFVLLYSSTSWVINSHILSIETYAG